MGMIRPLIKPSLSSGLRPALRASFSKITRYFTEFDEVAQSYILVDSQIDTSGSAITIEVEIACNYLAGQRNFVGLYTTNALDAFGLRMESGGFLKFYSSGYTPAISGTNIADGKLHKVSATINKTTGDYDVYLDGALDYSGTHSAPAMLRDSYYVSIGARATSLGKDVDSYYEGYLSNCKVQSDSVTSLNMPIDQRYTSTDNIVIDRSPMGNNGTFINISDNSSELFTLENGDWLGEELVTQENWESPYTASSGWTYNEVDNTWSLSGDGTAQGLFPIASFAQPLPVRVVANVLQVDGDGLLFSSSASTGAVTEVGVTTKIVTPDIGTFAQFKRATGIVNAKISKPSVKAYRKVAY